MSEIRLLNVCRTLQSDPTTSSLDAFTSIGSNWSDAGTWSLNGVTTTGIIVASSGRATTNSLDDLYTAAFASQSISTSKYREVVLDYPSIPTDGGEVSILMDMDNTTPVPGGSVRFRVVGGTTSSDVEYYDLYLYSDEVQQKTLRIRARDGASSLKMSIDSSNTIRCYVGATERFNHRPTGYTAAGGRVGIGLVSSTTLNTSVDAFTFRYTVDGGALDADELPPRCLVASANGRLYVETKSGEMEVLGTDSAVVRTLASDRLLSSTNRLEKLYIADYELKKYGSGTGSNTTTTFSDSGVTDWSALSTGSDVILSGAFASDNGDWTKGAGWTIGAGVATATGAISTDLSQTVDPLTANVLYRVVFTVTRTAGSITAVCGTQSGTARSSSATFTEDIRASTTDVFKFTTSGFTGTVDNVSATPITNRVDADDDRLEIISGTGVTTGIYGITTVGTTTLTLASSPGASGSAITYRIVRAPKVFDSAAMTLTLVPIGTIGTSQFPIGCTIVATWLDRLVWGGDPLNPHIVYFSAAGDPNDYEYVTTIQAVVPGGAFVFDPVRTTGTGQIGDAVTAIIPHSNDYCLIAGYRSMTVLRGDPTDQGRLDLISRDIGIIDKFAYCYTPEQTVVGLSADGLYEFPPTPTAIPQRLSRERMPAELTDINVGLNDVQLAFDLKNQGINLFITPKTAGASTHWWFDWSRKAFWMDTYNPSHEPTASCVHTINGENTPTVIFGCRDGYLRRAVNSAGYDDDQIMPSTALLGPFGSAFNDAILHEVLMEMATNSGQVTVDVLVGDTPEKAYNALPFYTFTIGGGQDSFAPVVQLVRARGGAFFIRITNETLYPWAVETLGLVREVVGRRRFTN